LAFFVHRFDEKASILDLMQKLGNEFLQDQNQHWLTDAWDLKSLENYATDLDYTFIATHHDMNAPIPFKNGNNPISNGNCPYIKVIEGGGKVVDSSRTFADCQETALRQFICIGLYDAAKKIFTLPQGVNNPYLTNFLDKQKPYQANNGDSAIRGAWNLVVGGIPGVRYRQGINELDAGYINFIKVMWHVLGISKDTLPKSQGEVIKELTDLLKMMNPQLKEIKINIPNFSEQAKGRDGKEKDFYGNATIQVKNFYDQEFSFVLRQLNEHGDIQNLKWLASSTSLGSPKPYKDEILNLVDNRNNRQGGYQLLTHGDLLDDNQKIDRVDNLTQKTKNYGPCVPIADRMLLSLQTRDDYNINRALDITKHIRLVISKARFML
jgi:hypothetical protein